MTIWGSTRWTPRPETVTMCRGRHMRLSRVAIVLWQCQDCNGFTERIHVDCLYRLIEGIPKYLSGIKAKRRHNKNISCQILLKNNWFFMIFMLLLIESRLCLRLLRQRSLLKQRQLPSLSHRTLDGYNMVTIIYKLYYFINILNSYICIYIYVTFIRAYVFVFSKLSRIYTYIYISLWISYIKKHRIVSPKFVPCIIILYHAFPLPWPSKSVRQKHAWSTEGDLSFHTINLLPPLVRFSNFTPGCTWLCS